MRTLSALLPFFFLSALNGQTLPDFIQSHYPAPYATGVPRNSAIAVRFQPSVELYGIQFRLTDSSGTVVPVTTNIYGSDTSFRPSSTLAPSTKYTFSITGSGLIYSFSFNTGTGNDTTPPRLIAVSPDPSKPNADPFGPFEFRFDKELLSPNPQNAFTVTDGSGGTYGRINFVLTTDRRALQVIPGQIMPIVQITLDPTKLTDMAGNAGTGSVSSSRFLTQALGDTAGPQLVATYPEHGDSAVPTNAKIQLLFDRALDDQSLRSGGIVVEGVPPGTFPDPAYSGGLVLLRGVTLEPNTTYRVRITTKLVSRDGLPVERESALEFRTAASPTSWQEVSSVGPLERPAPVNAPIVLRSAQPLPRFAPLLFTNPSVGTNRTDARPVKVTLSEDRRTLVLVSADGSWPAWTGVVIGENGLVDITGAQVSAGLQTETTGSFDLDAPRLAAITPEDGAQDVPTNIAPAIRLNEAVGLQTPSDALRVTRNGEPVSGRVRFPQMDPSAIPATTSLSFQPDTPLDADTEYQFEIRGVVDQAGNSLPSETIHFRTAVATATPGAVLRRIESNADSGDLEPTQPIELTFDGPLRAAATIASVKLADGGRLHPVEVTVSGGLIRIAPVFPWPSNRTLSLSLYTADRWGRSAYEGFSFRAKPSSDTTRPEVISISPAPGTPIVADQRVVIKFSEPMLDVTAANGIFANQVESLTSTGVTWSPDRTTVVTGPFTGNALKTISVAVTAALTDLAGNPAKPFTAIYPVVPPKGVASLGLPTVLASWPRSQTNATMDARAPVSLYLSAAIDGKRFNDFVWMVTPTGRAQGNWEMSAGGRLAILRPDSPWPAGSNVSLVQLEPVIQLPYGFSFARAAPVFTLQIRQTSMGALQPANAPVDVEFTRDIGPGPSPVELLTGPRSTDTLVSCDETWLSPRVIRLTPKTPLTPGYSLLIRSRNFSTTSTPMAANSTVGPALTSDLAPATTRAPAPGTSASPITVRVAAVWPSGLNPVSVSETTVSVTANGRNVPAVVSVSPDGTIVRAAPLEPLPPDQQIAVNINGVEDRLGRKYPSESWTFQTGSEVDVTPPEVLYTNAQNNMDPLVPLALTFSEPLDPFEVAAGFPNSRPPLSLQISPDLRTVTYARADGWNRGEEFSFSPRYADLSGNQGSVNISLTAAFDSDATPALLSAASVRDGQAGLPLLGRFSLLFSKPVPGGGITMVRLTRGSEEVPLSVSSVAGNRTTLRPRFVLDPNTTYQLAVTGVQNPAAITFTTGEQLNDPVPTAMVRYAGPNAPVEIRFSVPLDVTTLMQWSNALTWVDWRGGNGYTKTVPVTTTWSSDAKTVRLTPASPLTTGVRYTVNLSSLRSAGDVALTAGPLEFVAIDAPERAPVTLTFTPADGSIDVPLGVRVQVAFSRAGSAPRIRLMESEVSVPATSATAVYGSFSITGTVALTWPLKPNTNYRIEVDSFEDDQGNSIPATSSSFRTGTLRLPSRLVLTSTSPANGEAGVSPTAPWVFNFNNPLIPAVFLEPLPQTSRTFPFRTTTQVQGSTLTLRPDPAWPAASTVTLTLFPRTRFGIPTVQDWAGQELQLQTTVTMRTAAINDPVPPVLESVVPAAGSTIPGGKAEVTLRFSKPVSLGEGALQVFYGSNKVSPTGVFSSDFRSVTYTLLPPENSRVTIVGTDAIRDNADNPMTPFVLEYPTGDALPFGPPTARLTEPSRYTEVPPTTDIVVRFDRVMDVTSVLSAVHVTQDGQNADGSITPFENGRSYRFHPVAPFKPGATVNVFISVAAQDTDGQAYKPNSSGLIFSVAADPVRSPMTITYRGFDKTIAADEALEVKFSQPLDPESVDDATVWLRSGNRLVAGSASVRDDGYILRFTPQFLLQPGTEYVLTAGSGLRAVSGASFAGQDMRFIAEPATATPAIESVAETELDGVRALRVRFTQPINPLARIEGAADARRTVDAREILIIKPSDEAAIESRGQRLMIRNRDAR